MAKPIIQKTGSISGASVAGEGSNDLVAGEVVNLANLEPTHSGSAHFWELLDSPLNTTITLVDPATATPSFVVDPDITLAGSYEIKCTVDGSEFITEIYAKPMTNTGGRIPAHNEQSQYDGGGNAAGWHEAETDFKRATDALVGPSSVASKGVTKLSVAPAVASNPIAVGDNDPRLSASNSVSVVNIDDPSTELNAIAGSSKGDTRLVYQTVAGTDEWTLYAWDDADSGAEAVPYTVDGSSGMWGAIAGKYTKGDQFISGNITLGLNQRVVFDDDADSYITSTVDDAIAFYALGSSRFQVGFSEILSWQTMRPASDYLSDLGTSTRRWHELFVGMLDVAPQIKTSGILEDIKYVAPAHTGLTALAEVPSVLLDVSSVKTWATGAIASQSFIKATQPTIAFAAASTVTNADTLYIEGAPIAGANATITTPAALRIASGQILTSNGSITDPTYSFYNAPGTGLSYYLGSLLALSVAGSPKVYINATGVSIVGAGAEAAPIFRPVGSDANTGFWQPSSDILAISTGGVEAMRLDASQDATFAGDIFIPQLSRIVLDTDGDTYLTSNGDDNLQIVSGGFWRIQVASSFVAFQPAIVRPNVIDFTDLGATAQRFKNYFGRTADLEWNAGGITEAVGLRVGNTTDAATSAQQYSPAILLEGQGWDDFNSQTADVEFSIQSQSIQNVAASPTAKLNIRARIEGVNGGISRSVISLESDIANDTDILTINPEGTHGQLNFGASDLNRIWTDGSIFTFLIGGGQRVQFGSSYVYALGASSVVTRAAYGMVEVDTGLYHPAADTVGVLTGGVEALLLDASQNATFKGDVLPGTDSTNDLGTTSVRWRDLYVDNSNIGGTLNHDGTLVGLYSAVPVAQSAPYTDNYSTPVRVLDASATADNNAEVLSALLADLQATGIIG